MSKLLMLSFSLIILFGSAQAVIVKDYRGMDPNSDYPSSTRYRVYQDDSRYNRGGYYTDRNWVGPYYNYNPFPDSRRQEQIFEQNR